VVEDDDQAAVQLLETLERQIGDRPAALAGIEEFREWGRHDTPGCRVQDQATRHHGDRVPRVLEDAAFGVDVQQKPAHPRRS
jgi:hypothetical protein